MESGEKAIFGSTQDERVVPWPYQVPTEQQGTRADGVSYLHPVGLGFVPIRGRRAFTLLYLSLVSYRFELACSIGPIGVPATSSHNENRRWMLFKPRGQRWQMWAKEDTETQLEETHTRVICVLEAHQTISVRAHSPSYAKFSL